MPVVTNGRLLFVNHVEGFINPETAFKYVEEDIDLDLVPLNGGTLLKTLVLSSDPYMRDRMRRPDALGFAPLLSLGQPVDNFGVAVVVRSEDPKFSPGDYVSGYINFETYSVWPGPPEQGHFFRDIFPIQKIEKNPELSPSAFIGALGLPGGTAYGGWKSFGEEKAKTSKTLFVSNAAGPVGAILVQLAKRTSPHLKVIASAGSEEKVNFLKEIGADVAFNYKQKDVNAELKEHGPIDIYWDNTAGPTLDAAFDNMEQFGLIIACGAISGYNDNQIGVKHFERVFQRSLTVRGFLYGNGEEQQRVLRTHVSDVTKLLLEGKIKVKEHRYDGLKAAGQALLDVHTGANFGKAVIVVADQ